MPQPLQEPTYDFPWIARRFLVDALQQLEINTITQRVYPAEIYGGFRAVNAARAARGQWTATGQGVKSFKGMLVNNTPESWTYQFSFNDYLRFVDMGVGMGTKYADVDNARKARFKSRYVRQWQRTGKGQSQRPAIMMELRHLQRRMQNYLVDFYGSTAEVRLVNAFEQNEFPILQF